MSQTILQETTTCYHCGDDCKNDSILIEDKAFCCQGCKTVYELLNENELCMYYDLRNHPGIKIKRSNTERFAFLDNEEIVTKLLDFNEGTTARVRLYIPKIHCSSCIWLLENLYKLKNGITTSRVDFVKREISLSYDKRIITLRTIAELLESFGYSPEINLESYEQQKVQKTDRSIFFKIGVAAFCSANIMLLSFPDYFGMEDLSLQDFFHYLNLIL